MATNKFRGRGYFYKKSGGFGGAWKKRYFVLEESILRYFSSPGSDQRGIINLAEGRGVRQRDQCEVDWPYEAKKHLCFGIATESRTYYLYATNMQSIQEWVTEIQRRIQQFGCVSWDWQNDIQGKPESDESKSMRGAVQIASMFAKGVAQSGVLSDTESKLVKAVANVAEKQAAVDVNTSWKERAKLGATQAAETAGESMNESWANQWGQGKGGYMIGQSQAERDLALQWMQLQANGLMNGTAPPGGTMQGALQYTPVQGAFGYPGIPPGRSTQGAFGYPGNPPGRPMQGAFGYPGNPPGRPTQGAFGYPGNPPGRPTQGAFGYLGNPPGRPTQGAFGYPGNPPGRPMQGAFGYPGNPSMQPTNPGNSPGNFMPGTTNYPGNPAFNTTQDTVPLYRYWKSSKADHFYTTNMMEICTATPGAIGHFDYKSEGIQCFIFKKQVMGTVPLYRYWAGGDVIDHFYTTNAQEIGTTTEGQKGAFGYVSEGIAGYCYPTAVCGTIPLYRYYSEQSKDHFYTTNPMEIGTTAVGEIGHHGYKSEGIVCYVFPYNS